MNQHLPETGARRRPIMTILAAMADLVRITLSERNGAQIAAIAGEVDMASLGDVRSALQRAVDASAHGFVLDLTAATYLDSAAVAMLFEFADGLRRRGQQLRLVVPDDALMRKTLLLTGVDRIAPVHADVDVALAALARPE
jgi:anti-sigma B factor antagonist